MEEKLTDEQLYLMKNEYLNTFFEEVSPKDFYRDIFPEGSFERAGHPEDGKANGILTVIEHEKAQNYMVFDDLNGLVEVQDKEFVVLSPISYSGRNRTAKNARWLHGIAIDLDGVEMPNLRDFFYQVKNGFLPMCTYCINSGHGLHLYYVLEKPVALYQSLQRDFKEFKYQLIAKIWNRYTSTFTERDQVQYQGIFQGFRMVGTQSKLGKDYPVRAFQTGEKVTIEHLNGFLMDTSKAITRFHYKSNLSLEEARKKYPEWYESKILKGEPCKRWHVKRDLYDWWIRKIKTEASAGHRYSCLCVLATYAVKCDIPEDELLTDALALFPFLDSLSDEKHGRFTKRDVMDAMKFYKESYVMYSRKEAEKVSAIPIPPNKRNRRKQEQHLQFARGIRAVKANLGESVSGGGRPSAEQKVREWRKAHPEGRKVDCIRETGLSKKTVYKWWEEPKPELEEPKNKIPEYIPDDWGAWLYDLDPRSIYYEERIKRKEEAEWRMQQLGITGVEWWEFDKNPDQFITEARKNQPYIPHSDLAKYYEERDKMSGYSMWKENKSIYTEEFYKEQEKRQQLKELEQELKRIKEEQEMEKKKARKFRWPFNKKD